MAIVKNTQVMMSDGGGSGKKKSESTSTSPISAGVAAGLIAGAKAATLPVVTAAKSGGGSGVRASAPAVVTPAVTQQNVDSTAYAQALSAAEAARQGMPIYAGSYDGQIADLAAQIAGREGFKAPGSFDDQIADLYAQINGRADFSYDLNGDAFWQQYKDKYTQGAKSAMRDTMGRAAALTGGYGSSYAQAVGQQAYDRRMEELMDIAPELYQMAYQRYQDEGDDLQKRLGLARDMANDEYDKAYRQYTDEGDALLQQLSVARQMANDEYGKYTDDYNRWLTERGYADDRLDAAYKQQQNNLAFLQSMMALGYTPTAQEIADAGLNSSQYAALASQYAPKRGGGGGGSGGGSRSTPDTSTSNPKYSLDDFAKDVSLAKHSNQREELIRAYTAAAKNGNAAFSVADLNKYVNDHHL